MNVIFNIIHGLNLEKIRNLKGDFYELALVRMVCIEISKYYYRDEIFYLFKENLVDRTKIYNDNPSQETKNITCKSLCKVLKKILAEEYGLNVEIPTIFTDRFAHIDVILTTKENKKYVINPLMDLVEYKVGLKTTNFASKKMSDYYKEKIPDIDYISDCELLAIDEVIGYAKNGKYRNFEDISFDNVEDAIKLILSSRGYINGIVDLKIFSSSTIKSLTGKKFNILDIYIDEQDNKDLKDLEFNNNGRYRGLIIMDKDKVYLFPVHGSYNKYSTCEWNELVENNNIRINTYAYVENLSKLKEFGIDRNILHNRKFLEIFSYYENLCKKNGCNIMDYIEYTKTYIRIKYNCELLFYIEGNELVVVDYQEKSKEKYIFKDENDVKKEKKFFLEFRDRLLIDEYMKKTNYYGVFEMQVVNSDILDYLTKCGDKYFSRNYKQYYIFDSVKELLIRREKIIKILINNKNLSNDEKYVLLDNLLNISVRLYYLSGLNNIIEEQTNIINKNYEMLVCDIINFVSFILQLEIPLNFKEYENVRHSFNAQEVLQTKRRIEIDNKVHILKYINEIIKLLDRMKLEDYFVVTVGYESIYLGPFLSSLTDKYSSMLICNEFKKNGGVKIDEINQLRNLIADSSKINNRPIVLLNDSMKPRTIIEEIKSYLISSGYEVEHICSEHSKESLITIQRNNQK